MVLFKVKKTKFLLTERWEVKEVELIHVRNRLVINHNVNNTKIYLLTTALQCTLGLILKKSINMRQCSVFWLLGGRLNRTLWSLIKKYIRKLLFINTMSQSCVSWSSVFSVVAFLVFFFYYVYKFMPKFVWVQDFQH